MFALHLAICLCMLLLPDGLVHGWMKARTHTPRQQQTSSAMFAMSSSSKKLGGDAGIRKVAEKRRVEGDSEEVLDTRHYTQGGPKRLAKGDGAELNKLIIDALADARRDGNYVEKLKVLVAQRGLDMNYVHAVTMLHRCAKQRVDLTLVLPLSQVLAMLQRPGNNFNYYKASEISMCIYSLKAFSLSTPGIDDLISFLAQKTSECEGKFNGIELGSAFYGLSELGSSSTINKLVEQLNFQFGRMAADAKMSAQDVSSCLFGLRKLNVEESVEMLDTLDVIARILEESSLDDARLQFNSHAIGNALHGLQGATTEHPQVLRLLTALAKKIREANEPLSGQSIGAAMFGLRRMSAKAAPVKEVLEALTVKINELGAVMDAVSLSNALYGLRCMSDDSLQVRDLLVALRNKLIAHDAFVSQESTSSSSESMSDKYQFDAKEISNSLSGLRRMSGAHVETISLLGAISDKLSPSPLSQYFRSIDIGRSLYGLQSMNVTMNDAESRMLLIKLGAKVATCKSPLTGRDVGLALYGFKSCLSSNDVPEIRAVLGALARRIKNDVKQPLNAKSMTQAMLGLQGMSSEQPEVRQVLEALAPLIGPLDTQACGNILYSISRMSSEEKEVRKFISALAPRIDACRGGGQDKTSFSAQELSNMLYGLMGMDSNHKEVIDLLQAVSSKIKESPQVVFTAQGIGNSLSGLQSMSFSDSPVVEEVFGLLADKVEQSEEMMEPIDLANAVYGLQGSSAESTEVRAVLVALLPKFQQSEGIFSARDIGYCLTGMSSMVQGTCTEVDDILAELSIKVSRSPYQGLPEITFMQFGRGVKVKSYQVKKE